MRDRGKAPHEYVPPHGVGVGRCPLYEILPAHAARCFSFPPCTLEAHFTCDNYTVRERVENGRYMLITGVGYTTEDAWFSCNVPPLQILATETKDNAEKLNYRKKFLK